MKKLVFNDRPVEVKAETYRNNNTLALTLNYEDGDRDVVTVNLNSLFQSDSMVFLDTNHYPDIERWIRQNGLGIAMNVTERSGFCEYPLYTINTSAL